MSTEKENKMAPPTWQPSDIKYEDWRFHVELWIKALDFCKKEKEGRGYLLFEKLRDVKEKGVGEKLTVATQNGEIDLFGSQGAEQILQVLDRSFKKDDLSIVCGVWSTFIHMIREPFDKMDEFITKFEKKVADLIRCGIDLPQVVLAMQIIDAANITDKEKQIVLTAVDYSKKDQMFDQSKSALRKFFGERISMTTAVKQECEDVNITRGGYGRGKSNWQRKPKGVTMTHEYQGNKQTATKENMGTGTPARGRGSRRKSNPSNSEGNPMCCRICDSVMHFQRNCPHSYENQSKQVFESKEESINEVRNLSLKDEHVLMVEAVNAAVLDCACSRNVMGKVWKDTFMASLSPDERNEVVSFPGGTSFNFGGGMKIKSIEKIKFPCVIAGTKATIISDVVERDIPLLLSKPEMKKHGFILNMKDDTLEVEDRKVELDTTSSGHYYLPLKQCEVEVEEVCMSMEDKSCEEKFKIVTKLHRQFAHPSAKNLKALLKNAEHLDDEISQIVDNISVECETCKRYKKTPPTLVVSLPLATRFNEVIAMDLKKFGDVYFLQLIDLFTRFCKSEVIMRKTPSVIIDSVITEWIGAGMGAPDKFLIDNGGEFDNESYHEFAEQFNVEICATGAQSPWSNGVCERNHYVIDVCVQKLREEDPNVNLNVALAWAVNAKNSMMNYNGYSPIQLVLGINPNLPFISSNKLPAMEDIEVSDILRKHLNTLHAARHAYVKSESDERIRRALRHPVRVTEVEFNQGDKVFIKEMIAIVGEVRVLS